MSASDFLDGEIAKKHLPKAVPTYWDMAGPKKDEMDTRCITTWTITGRCEQDSKEFCTDDNTKIKCPIDQRPTAQPVQTQDANCGKRRKH